MKLLVVDDSKAMRMIIRRALRQANIGDHTVTEAVDGLDALEKLRAETFDVVLADWNMPQMNGLELLKAAKADGLAKNFGFITSEGTDEIRRLGQENGADFLIVKPFTPEAIHAALKPWVGA